MPTIREVAARARVSSATVSHVINGTRHVSDELRERVQEAMAQLGYQPNQLARALRRGESLTLGLILPDSANPFFAEVGRWVETASFALGYNVILCNTEGDPAKESMYVNVLLEKRVDGVAFVSVGEESDSLRRLLEVGLPVVVLDRDMPGMQVDAVLIDNHLGGQLATSHLLSLGHRRIGCICGPSNITPSAERVTGYRSALAQATIAVEEKMIVRGDFHPTSGHALARQLLAIEDAPTAIFACNDLMAIGVLHAADEKGCKVPEELAVVGFDDIELASYTNPPLTSVAQPKQLMAERAVELLIARIRDPNTTPRREKLAPRLTIRRSSGAQR